MAPRVLRAASLLPVLAIVGCGGGYEDLTTSVVHFAVAAGVLGAAVVGFFVLRTRGSGAQNRAADTPDWEEVDVSAIVVALDYRFRNQLHNQLGDYVSSRQSSVPEDMARGIREVALALRRAETSWLYARVINAKPASAAQARKTFAEAAEAAHQANEALPTTPGAPAEGDPGGVAVITLLVAASREIPDVEGASDAGLLGELLSSYVALSPRTLAQMEVIWAPEGFGDRMSLEQMRAVYPDLVEIDPATLPPRTFCDACGAPYSEALTRCPHCAG